MANFFDQIQDYVDGNLKGEALSTFEEAMAHDETLQEEVERRQMIQNTLEHHEQVSDKARQLETLLQTKKDQFIHSEKKASSTKTKVHTLRNWGIGLAVAASLALLLMVTGVFDQPNYGSLPTMPDYAVRGEQTNTVYKEARKAFNQKNYDKAVMQLNQLHNTSQNSALYTYYLGLSYLGNKNYKAAIPLLKTIALGPSIYRESATYYLGYSYYKTKKYTLAKTYLSKVSADSKLFKKANQLIKKMGK